MYEKDNEQDFTLETQQTLLSKLPFLKTAIKQKRCFLGFDGFIDYLSSLVESRSSLTDYTIMEKMESFASLINSVTGSSAGVESILKKISSGGFTSNTCKGLLSLGMEVEVVGTWGFPILNKAFSTLISDELVNIKSISEPGSTVGLEFNDGKIMITDFKNSYNISWKLLKEKIGVDKLIDIFNDVDFVGMGYWSPIPDFQDIMNHIIRDIFPSLSNRKIRFIFIDLADTKKRSHSDLKDFLLFLKQANDEIPILLSLNDQEAIDVSKAIGIKSSDRGDLKQLGSSINDKLNLNWIAIHDPQYASISTRQDHFWIKQAFTAKPKFTVSAGDHFNAGLAAGLAVGLEPNEALLLGNIMTSIFIRTGISPDLKLVAQFLNDYLEYLKIDNPEFKGKK